MKKIATRVSSLVVSWDFLVAIALTIPVGIYLYMVPISFEIAKEIYAVSISVLAILFSIFFAALAVLITAGDNKFVQFLQEDGLYTEIIWYFKYTMSLLFFALAGSIVLFVISLPCAAAAPSEPYPWWLMTIFAFFGPYALFTAADSTRHAIKYAEYRAAYLEICEDNDNEQP